MFLEKKDQGLMDFILDKVNREGIDSLDKVEKDFLDNWNNPNYEMPDSYFSEESELNYIESQNNGKKDADYVFEYPDGEIVNIQYNLKGLEVIKKYKNGDEFTKWMKMRESSPDAYYKDFYDAMYLKDKTFSFIGYADGHSARLFE